MYSNHTPSMPGRAIRLLLLALLWLPYSFAFATPSLQLPDLTGKVRNVNEFIGKGQWVIVAVWSADCTICQRDIYHMTFLQDEHKDKGVRVLGLSIDGLSQLAKAQAFADEQSLNFPNLIGNPGDASRLSGQRLAGTPTYYFFAPDGRYLTLRVGSMTQEQAERILDALKKAR